MKQYVGRELGVSDWTSVTQHDINLFAGVTGDWQWIHTDPDRAADGPFAADASRRRRAPPAGRQPA
ncbi:MAG TPA: MaoC/PaaZ C-terminal domain-containing protein [Baekduia sp.]|nr:MaoC/PaaZ C-terminal domain-containing protein [Baekduia sp.]